MADGSARAGAAAARLRDRGVEVLATDGTIAGALGALVARGVHSLLVEGGPTLQAACWAAGVVDRVSQLVGDRAFGPGCRTLGRAGLAERVGPANRAARARCPHGSRCLRD